MRPTPFFVFFVRASDAWCLSRPLCSCSNPTSGTRLFYPLLFLSLFFNWSPQSIRRWGWTSPQKYSQKGLENNDDEVDDNDDDNDDVVDDDDTEYDDDDDDVQEVDPRLLENGPKADPR